MTYTGNRWLSLSEMTVNAQYVLDYFLAEGWTKNAICGMLGNMQSESSINPGIWQGLHEGNMFGGFGIVQWTPATNYTNWADANGYTWDDMDANLKRILYELDHGLQWYATTKYNFSFTTFTQSTATPEYLADAFLKNYERPANQNQPIRQTQARYWYNALTGGGGIPSPPVIDIGGKLPPPITTDKKRKLITLWLTDALNGWKL